jgi:CBS domain-containing protein
MLASELISQVFAPLRTSDTGEEALTIMHVYHVKHMPIVNQKQLLGTISEDDILNQDMDEPIGSYGLSLVRAYVSVDAHLFEIMAKMAEFHLTTIPVLGADDEYLGAITQEALILFYADTFSFKEPGSILVLEMPRRDYSLAEISRIVEAEGIAILISFLTSDKDSEKVYVTIKINTQDAQHAIATLQRHDYEIRASFAEETYFEDLKERYDALMAYLNV